MSDHVAIQMGETRKSGSPASSSSSPTTVSAGPVIGIAALSLVCYLISLICYAVKSEDWNNSDNLGLMR